MGNLPFCPSSCFGLFVFFVRERKFELVSRPGTVSDSDGHPTVMVELLNLSVKIMFMIVGRVDQVK